MESKYKEVLTPMSKISLIVRYDGSALAEHSMDVADLALALIGLSEIVKIYNKKFNGDRSAVKVLVKVDTEQKCFSIQHRDHANTFPARKFVSI